MFQKILIANRGEIARRVINAIREMGITTVAIHSDPDAEALHVKEADEAYSLNGIESAETYLDIQKIIQIAKDANVDAIHPGYGFLSENAEFAEACEKAKIKFIGPDPKSLKMLGSKIASKELAKKAKVPTVPGYVGATGRSPLPHGKELKKLADEIGYPLLVKAAAGGGGKGMRVVHHPDELEGSVEGAEREAFAFFKDKTLFIEKYFENPKHIEVQILGDEKGNLVHLFERECSVQRRHQKMIEETPSPSIDSKTRKEICEAALRLAKEVHYYSAGTFEFLFDQKGNYYFLEANTRLQVEHPITELVTGIDLVKAQIRIAAGERLPFKQSDINQRGHAIECRLYAEDPENNFLPSDGMVGVLIEPMRPGIRIDSGLEQGKPILPFYDPLLAKLIVWSENREEATTKMDALLRDYILLGVRHNLDFLRYTIQSKAFQSGKYHTHTAAELMEGFLKSRKDNEALAASIALLASSQKQPRSPSIAPKSETNLLDSLQGFRNI
jgi:acetyl-CoA carboxylase biotin carboxylase subunit